MPIATPAGDVCKMPFKYHVYLAFGFVGQFRSVELGLGPGFELLVNVTVVPVQKLVPGDTMVLIGVAKIRA